MIYSFSYKALQGFLLVFDSPRLTDDSIADIIHHQDDLFIFRYSIARFSFTFGSLGLIDRALL